MMVDATQWSIIWPALAAGLLVTATHVPLGMQVLDRGIVFIDLAIAQVAGLGVVIADFFGWEPSGWSVQIAAVIAALAGAGFLIWTERRLAAVQEAVIGVVFVVAASAEIVLLSYNPHGADELKDLLVGQILWVVPGDLIPAAILYAIVIGFIIFIDLSRWRVLFYALFAVTVTASVQLVGVFLVFASLIIPSLAVRGIRGPRAMVYAYAIGLAGYALGLLSSALFDLPTGAAVVCALALVAALTGLGRAARVGSATVL